MTIEKRQDKKGHYYCFYYWKDGKRIRIKQDTHKRFEDKAEAEAYDKILFAGREAEKSKIERRMVWRDKFQNFEELVSTFEDYQRRNAPNSYAESVRYLRYYVFDFYLNLNKNNNVAAWHLDMQSFRDWVESDAKALRSKKPLSYSSKNKALHALNSFLECLNKYKLISIESVQKCEVFGRENLNEKDHEFVVSEDEYRAIHEALLRTHRDAADAWQIAYFTGMRINEILSLTMAMLKGGHPKNAFGEELSQIKIDCSNTGYIRLTHQLPRFVKRLPDGKIANKKPLKGRKKIHPKNDRLIPIENKEAWNMLVARYYAQEKLFTTMGIGAEKDNYLLFEGVSYTEIGRALSDAYARSIFSHKTYHACRHSFCTNFVGKYRNFFLARAILGHKTDAFERYLHIYERMSSEAAADEKEIKFAT